MIQVNKSFVSTALSLLIVTVLTQAAFASTDPAQIQVTGTVNASPCEIDESSVSPVNVNLGDDLQTADLNQAGSSSEWVPVTIALKNCPAGTSSVTATFSGTADAADPETLYTNTGTATNVAVQLEGLTSEPYGNGKTSTLQIADATDGKPTWKLQTRAFSKAGGVTPGTISSVITMSFAYN